MAPSTLKYNTSFEPRLKLAFLDDSFSSANMGAIWYIARKIFSWTHENCLSNHILKLCFCWSFPITHLFYLFWPSIIIGVMFDCATNKVYETITNEVLHAFSMFLFFLQYYYYYSIFYFLYFCSLDLTFS